MSKEHKSTDKSVVLPSIWEPIRDNSLIVQLATEVGLEFRHTCTEEEMKYRFEVKEAMTQLAEKYKLTAAERVMSTIPIMVEYAIEHANVNTFSSAAADFANVADAFTAMLESDSMLELVQSDVSEDRKDIGW